jgi:hypothetical protein
VGWNGSGHAPDPAEPPAEVGGADRSAFLTRVAEAEGLLESFGWRLALEHRIAQPDLDLAAAQGPVLR